MDAESPSGLGSPLYLLHPKAPALKQDHSEGWRATSWGSWACETVAHQTGQAGHWEAPIRPSRVLWVTVLWL